MDENKNINKAENTAPEKRVPAPPPVVPKKENNGDDKKKNENKSNKKLFVLIPVIAVIVIAAVVLAVVLKGEKPEPLDPIILTDQNGVPVTDESGEPVTVIPETEVHEYTDSKGNNKTTVVYKEVTVYVPVTDAKGEAVTDKDGEVVTEKQEIIPTTVRPTSSVIGTTVVPITDGQGHTGVDNQGNVLTTIVEITSNPAVVTPASIDWKASQGGTAADYFSSVATLEDGSYISAVVTNSTDGQYAEFKDLKYVKPFTVLTKYSKSGDVVWQKVVGSKRGITAIESVIPTKDGGFYAVGYGKNIGAENGKGYYDGAVYKFDSKGEELWHNSFGTSTVDIFNCGVLTSDGGVVAVGSVGNNDKDAEGFNKPELKSAACIVKYSSDGKLVWKNIVGGDRDTFNGVVEGADGSLFCVGNFYSGELFTGLGSADSGVAKFTSSGEYVDIAPIAGTGIESFKGITACKNGGVAVVGTSNSSDAGSTESMFVSNLASRGGYDAYIMRFNDDLSLRFAKPFRGQNKDELTCIVEKEDGTFIAAGSSNSSSRDLKGVTTRGGDDMVIACFDRMGDLSWARSFGGTLDDSANTICLADDGGYVVAGRTLSKDIDMKGIAQYVNGKSVGIIVKFPQ